MQNSEPLSFLAELEKGGKVRGFGNANLNSTPKIQLTGGQSPNKQPPSLLSRTKNDGSKEKLGEKRNTTSSEGTKERVEEQPPVGIIRLKSAGSLDEVDGSSELLKWQECRSRLADQIDPQIFSAYFDKLHFVDCSKGTLLLRSSSPLIARHVENRFRETILSAATEFFEGGVSSFQVQVSSEPAPFSAGTPPPSNSQSENFVVVKKLRAPSEQSPLKHSNPLPEGEQRFIEEGAGSRLNPKYTFESFVVGASNEFCHAAALQVAQNPGGSYNPLFIYGGVGLGKTHLLHAIGNSILKNRPQSRVGYLSSESFTNGLIRSLRSGTMDQFKRQLRNIDVLLIDDIQFMVGKERTQEEFFHTFNALYGAKNQIVITSDKIPQDIPGMEERLRTRFSWGLTADLQTPDLETRIAILRRKALTENIVLPDEVSELIATRVSSNVRELEGALTRLIAVCSLRKEIMSVELAQSALRDILEPKKVSLSITDIRKGVATHFSISVADIVSKKRTKNLSFPRHIAMYLCRKHTTASYTEIGANFGKREHTSVIHAANVVTTKIANDNSIREQVAEIEKQLFRAH